MEYFISSFLTFDLILLCLWNTCKLAGALSQTPTSVPSVKRTPFIAKCIFTINCYCIVLYCSQAHVKFCVNSSKDNGKFVGSFH